MDDIVPPRVRGLCCDWCECVVPDGCTEHVKTEHGIYYFCSSSCRLRAFPNWRVFTGRTLGIIAIVLLAIQLLRSYG